MRRNARCKDHRGACEPCAKDKKGCDSARRPCKRCISKGTPEQCVDQIKQKRDQQKEQHVSRACLQCKNDKTKCSDERPCARCVKKKVPCIAAGLPVQDSMSMFSIASSSSSSSSTEIVVQACAACSEFNRPCSTTRPCASCIENDCLCADLAAIAPASPLSEGAETALVDMQIDMSHEVISMMTAAFLCISPFEVAEAILRDHALFMGVFWQLSAILPGDYAYDICERLILTASFAFLGDKDKFAYINNVRLNSLQTAHKLLSSKETKNAVHFPRNDESTVESEQKETYRNSLAAEETLQQLSDFGVLAKTVSAPLYFWMQNFRSNNQDVDYLIRKGIEPAMIAFRYLPVQRSFHLRAAVVMNPIAETLWGYSEAKVNEMLLNYNELKFNAKVKIPPFQRRLIHWTDWPKIFTMGAFNKNSTIVLELKIVPKGRDHDPVPCLCYAPISRMGEEYDFMYCVFPMCTLRDRGIDWDGTCLVEV